MTTNNQPKTEPQYIWTPDRSWTPGDRWELFRNGIYVGRVVKEFGGWYGHGVLRATIGEAAQDVLRIAGAL